MMCDAIVKESQNLRTSGSASGTNKRDKGRVVCLDLDQLAQDVIEKTFCTSIQLLGLLFQF